MKLLFVILLLPVLAMCQNRKPAKVEYVKRYDYAIEVNVSNAFGGHHEKFILNNIQNPGSSIEKKPFVLYHIVTNTRENTVDTTERRFSRLEADSLFNLARQFFQNPSLDNVDTVVNGQMGEVQVADDSNATVTLEFRGRKLNASIEGISHPSNGRELNQLLRYLWSITAQK